MKKNKIVGIILILFSILIAALIEVIYFNGIKMHNIGENKGTFSLMEYATIEFKENEAVPVIKNEEQTELSDLILSEENEIETQYETKKIVKIKFDKMYVDRLVFNYTTDANLQTDAKYTSFDEYGNPVEETLYLTLLKEFNTATRVVQSDIDYIEFEIDSNSNVNFDIMDIMVKNEFCFNMYRFSIIAMFLLSLTLIYIFRKIVLKKIEYLFVIIALCMGFLQILLIPCLTLYSWDDHIHLDRMYSLFEYGKYETTKSYDYSYGLKLEISNIPASYEEFNMIHKYLNDNSNVEGDSMINEKKFISYDYFTYIPSAIAIKICKILKTPYTFLFHMGKIVNLLVYIGVMFYAIKNAKVGKKLLFVLALLPTNIFLAAQYSRDAIITAGIYLGVSTFLNCYCANDKMNRKNLLIFIFSIVIASLSKAIYIPFLLLILLIPKEKFENKKNSKWIKLLVISILIIGLMTFILPTATSSSANVSDVRGGDTSSGRQLQLILSQPISFARVFSNYLKEVITTKLFSGFTLGRWHNFYIIKSEKYLLLLLLIVFASVITENNEKKYKIDLKSRFLLLLISLLIICFICGSMYLSFTNVGSVTIAGVQERYYAPLLFAIFITFKNTKFNCKIKEENVMKIIIAILFYIYFFATYEELFLDLCL